MTQFPHEYALYGLTLRSNRPLPGLAPAREGHPVITLDFAGPLQERPATAPFFTNGFETLWHLAERRWLLQYEHAALGYKWTAAYENDHVELRWSDEAIVEDIPPVLHGPAIAAALHLRQVPLLHACVLAIDDFAIALIGAPGAGKSTTAAAFVAAGHALVSDDLAALQIGADEVRVESGYPRLRLFPDTAKAVGWDGDSLPRAFRSDVMGDKRFVELEPAAFRYESLPLRAIYVLQPRSASQRETAITRIGTHGAVPLLMQNIYSLRFLNRTALGQSLAWCARVAAMTAIRSVRACDDLSTLSSLVSWVSSDALGIEA
jgi:hypothetical protein